MYIYIYIYIDIFIYLHHWQVGCGDISGPEEDSPSCFLLDSAGVVLMDRRLLALDAQVLSQTMYELNGFFKVISLTNPST